jgi:hypothetical protein
MSNNGELCPTRDQEGVSMSKRTSKRKSRKKRGANHGKRPNGN